MLDLLRELLRLSAHLHSGAPRGCAAVSTRLRRVCNTARRSPMATARRWADLLVGLGELRVELVERLLRLLRVLDQEEVGLFVPAGRMRSIISTLLRHYQYP